jgi:hypothetical protein
MSVASCIIGFGVVFPVIAEWYFNSAALGISRLTLLQFGQQMYAWGTRDADLREHECTGCVAVDVGVDLHDGQVRGAGGAAVITIGSLHLYYIQKLTLCDRLGWGK